MVNKFHFYNHWGTLELIKLNIYDMDLSSCLFIMNVYDFILIPLECVNVSLV